MSRFRGGSSSSSLRSTPSWPEHHFRHHQKLNKKPLRQPMWVQLGSMPLIMDTNIPKHSSSFSLRHICLQCILDAFLFSSTCVSALHHCQELKIKCHTHTSIVIARYRHEPLFHSVLKVQQQMRVPLQF